MAGLKRAIAYWKKGGKEALEFKEMIAGKIAFILGIVIQCVRWAGYITANEITEKWLKIGEAVAFGFTTLYFLLWYPVKMDEEREKEINKIKESLSPNLEITGVESEITESHKICRIRVTNRGTKTADAVRAEFIAPPGGDARWGGRFPKQLYPVIIHTGGPRYISSALLASMTVEAPKDQSLNPGESVEFGLLVASKGTAQLESGGYNLSLQMSTPGDPLSTVFREHAMETNYRIRLKATARDFPETIQDFDMLFSGERSICRFTLTKATPCG